MSGADVAAADNLLEDTSLGLEVKGMQRIGITWELNFDTHPATVQRTMKKALIYEKNRAPQKEALSERTKTDRWI